MTSYLTAFAVPSLIVFSILWALLGFGIVPPAGADFWIYKAHSQALAKCSLGDIDIMGDSTAVADLIPSRIGPKVRDFGFDGGSPIDAYYMAQAMLRCPQKPKLIIVSFVPRAVSANVPLPGHPTFFWTNDVKYGVVNVQDAMQVLAASRKYNVTLIAGPRSLFDIDYRLKAALYAIRFPPFYFVDLQTYIVNHMTNRERIVGRQNLALYDQTLDDNGHHFFGTQADGGNALDIDANRSGNLISPLMSFYFERMIDAFAEDGIPVYFSEPSRNRTSAIHYLPSLNGNYQSYLVGLQLSKPNFHILGDGVQIGAPELFGDPFHLNLRGASDHSDEVRHALIAAGLGSLVYSDNDLKTKNLYDLTDADARFWAEEHASESNEITPAFDTSLPKLAYLGSAAWLYKAPSPVGGSAPTGIHAPDINLTRDTNYAASVLVKNVDAETASLKINWPGGTNGSVAWSFSRREISYSGTANGLNSGVLICPGGWVQLFLSATSGPNSTSYSGPVVSLSALNDASAYLYNATLERGLWPTNYCLLQNEVTTIPLPKETAAQQ